MPRLPGTERLGCWFLPGLLAGLLAMVMAWAPISSMVNLVRMPAAVTAAPLPLQRDQLLCKGPGAAAPGAQLSRWQWRWGGLRIFAISSDPKSQLKGHRLHTKRCTYAVLALNLLLSAFCGT